MSEADKQEGQKTVVSFITGLLIGGLLVWVFSSSPEQGVKNDMKDETATEETREGEDTIVTEPEIEVTTLPKTSVNTGNGSLTVSDQKAGSEVAVSVGTYPGTEGWVVVRDFKNGVTGNILGAARYHTEDGLLPMQVSLLRNTVAGNAYQVSFYTESGDKQFSTKDDVPVTGGEKVFTAQ